MRVESLCTDESGACMKPDFGVLFAVLNAPLIPVSSDVFNLPREFMVINGFLTHSPQMLPTGLDENQMLHPEITGILPHIG